jgi:transposase-like protein
MKPATRTESRIPPEYEGLQINFCRNIYCDNYGKPVDPTPIPHGRGHTSSDNYRVGGKAVTGESTFSCRLCSTTGSTKSNLAIRQEYHRLQAYLKPAGPVVCTNPDCPNGKPSDGASERNRFRPYGHTKAGSPRYRCLSCGKTFSTPARPSLRQQLVHKNRLIFRLLINKVPLSRICEIADVSPKTLYTKIDFIHRRCLEFLGSRERRLYGEKFESLYIAMDQQAIMVNWDSMKARKNIVLSLLAAAENETGYVFCASVNFDSSLDFHETVQEGINLGDPQRKPPHREFARFWLPWDYQEACEKSDSKQMEGIRIPRKQWKKDEVHGPAFHEEIEEDDEVETMSVGSQRIPSKGIQVHAEYTLYGQLLVLKELLAGAKKLRFFLDLDAGFRQACAAVFIDRILDRSCDLFYVRIKKTMKIDQRRAALAKAEKNILRIMLQNPEMTETDAKRTLLKQAIRESKFIGHKDPPWIDHPLPRMDEPEKSLCHLTEFQDMDVDHLANLFLKASLHGVDTFFMQVRRRCSLLERPIASRGSGRRWFGYCPYNPAMVQKVVDILRTVHNYVLPNNGDKRITPAMRLGLAKGVVRLEDILYAEHR